MAEATDRASEWFERTFHPRVLKDVCILTFAEDSSWGDSEVPAWEVRSWLQAGIESLLHAGIGGFVFDLTQFSRRTDLEESLGRVIQCTTVVRSRGAVLNWLRGSRFVEGWTRMHLLCRPPDNFETERDAVEAVRKMLKPRRAQADLAQRVLNSEASIRQIANAAGLSERDVRRIAEGLVCPSDEIALLHTSALDASGARGISSDEPGGAASGGDGPDARVSPLSRRFWRSSALGARLRRRRTATGRSV